MEILKYNVLIVLLALSFILTASETDRDSLQRMLYIANQSSEKIVLLNLLSKEWLDENPDKAYDFAQQALSLSKITDDSQGKADALFNMAAYSYLRQDYIAAINFYNEALEHFKTARNDQWQAKTYLEIGIVYKKKYEYEKALNAFFIAKKLFEKSDKIKDLAVTYNQIGGLFYDQEHYDRAFEYFQKSLDLYTILEDDKGLSALYNNVGEIYRLKGDYFGALDYFQKAIAISKKLYHQEYLAINYDNVGNIHSFLGNYDSAMFYLNESLKINKQINHIEGIAITSISLGNYYYKIDDYPKAIGFYTTGFNLASKYGYLNLTKEASAGLSRIYKNQDLFREALQYHRLYQQIGDSLSAIKNVEKITQLEMSLIFEQEEEFKYLMRQKQNYIFSLIGTGIIMIIILIVLLYGRMRIKIKHAKIQQENLKLEKKRLREEIDFKNRELTTKLMYLVKKNELINFISDKLVNAKFKFTKENQKMIQHIIVELQSNIDNNIWKNFEERFTDVHENFYKKLVEKNPNLTDNEKKLCAFLKLNMSTKDIAAITHQNPNSIEVARTRLRKKLDISNTSISLASFLSDL